MKWINQTHWMTWTHFYKIYRSILYRCGNVNYEYYHRYGWRWIQCEWKSFNEFKDDMYDDYVLFFSAHWKSNTTIDRIDNNGNYCKDNCKWATRKTQARNRTWKCRMITHNGITKSLSTWAEDLKIKASTIRMRIEYWWTIWQALWLED